MTKDKALEKDLERRTLNAMDRLASRQYPITLESNNDDEYCYMLFHEIYGGVPNVMYFFDEITKEERNSDENWDEDGEYHPKGKIDVDKTINNIINNYNCYVHVWKTYKLVVTEDFIVFRGTIFNKNLKKSKELISCIVEECPDQANLKFVSVDSRGNFNVKLMPINETEVDLQTNYNDDFPYEKIEEEIQGKDSSLILLHGKPGTGKSYFIRKLIKDNPDIKFYWLDSSMFSQINTTAFMDFLFSCKNSVFVLEDCEVILKDRSTTYNNLITPILNISDGILGDSLNLKFICTFNDELTNIDKALLRKGRLKIKYEFKELTKEKVKVLFDKFNIKAEPKEMPLCEVFNYTAETGVKEKKKIGF